MKRNKRKKPKWAIVFPSKQAIRTLDFVNDFKKDKVKIIVNKELFDLLARRKHEM